MRVTLSFRVWDKKNNKYLDLSNQAITNMGELMIKTDELLIGDYSNYKLYKDLDSNDYEVEYCTGYKDIDGKYLYVNDYVEFKLGLKMVSARIVYEHFAFWLYEIRGGIMPFFKYNYKITGNSHNE